MKDYSSELSSIFFWIFKLILAFLCLGFFIYLFSLLNHNHYRLLGSMFELNGSMRRQRTVGWRRFNGINRSKFKNWYKFYLFMALRSNNIFPQPSSSWTVHVRYTEYPISYFYLYLLDIYNNIMPIKPPLIDSNVYKYSDWARLVMFSCLINHSPKSKHKAGAFMSEHVSPCAQTTKMKKFIWWQAVLVRLKLLQLVSLLEIIWMWLLLIW